jgi:hypothetical protein
LRLRREEKGDETPAGGSKPQDGKLSFQSRNEPSTAPSGMNNVTIAAIVRTVGDLTVVLIMRVPLS